LAFAGGLNDSWVDRCPHRRLHERGRGHRVAPFLVRCAPARHDPPCTRQASRALLIGNPSRAPAGFWEGTTPGLPHARWPALSRAVEGLGPMTPQQPAFM